MIVFQKQMKKNKDCSKELDKTIDFYWTNEFSTRLKKSGYTEGKTFYTKFFFKQYRFY